jgi:outer membrane protein TolC
MTPFNKNCQNISYNFAPKKNHIISLVVLVLLFLVPVSTLAQETLNLEHAWNIAISNNYSLQQQEKLIQKAREEISIQKTGYYPTVSTMGISARAEFQEFPLAMPDPPKSVGLDLISLSINQPIFTGFRTKNMVKAAEEQQNAQNIRKEIIEDQLLLQIGRLYYNIQLNLLQQDVLKSSVQRISTQVQKIHNLLAMEQATPFDTLEITNHRLQISNQLTILQDQYEILFSKLKYILNTQDLPPLDNLPHTSPSLTINPLSEYHSEALKHRPELQNIAAIRRAQDFQSSIYKSRYYPQVSASLSYNYLKMKGNLFRNEWSDFYSFLVNFQWELWSWHKDKRKVQQAQIELDRLDLEHKQLMQDIKQQVKEAYQNLLSVRKQIQLQNKLLVQERERYRLTQERYDQGMLSSLDLRSSEHALTEAELEIQKNYIAWYQSQLNLDWAIGTIDKQ